MQRFTLVLSVSAVLLFLFSQNIFAQQSFTLFQTITETEVTATSDDAQLLSLRSNEIRAASLTIDFETLKSTKLESESLLEVSLFDNQTASFKIERTPVYRDGAETIISYSSENDRSYMLASWSNDRMIANVLDYENNTFYAIRYDSEIGEHRISEMALSQLDIMACGTADLPEVQEALQAAWENHPLFKDASRSMPDFTNLNGTALSDITVDIDVMLIYTPRAAFWSEQNEGGIEVSVSLMMAMSQLAMDLSEVNLNFRLVALKEIDYDETTTSSGNHLRRLTHPATNFGAEFDGYMEEVHDWRNFYGADLVGMLADVSDTGGIAWLLTDISGNANIGFSVNRIQQLTTSFTLVHEFGHNMGSHHGRNQNSQAAPESGALFNYSTGWRFTGTDGASYATVMNYNEGSLPAPVFSNPNVTWAGTPTGSYDGDHAPADNAASLEFSKLLVADYSFSFEDGPEFVANNSIDITLEENSSTVYTFELQNSGETWLNWSARFASDSNLYGNGNTFYQTAFGEEEGFVTGNHSELNGWEIVSQETHRFRIATANPSTGAQHLRIPISASNWIGVRSPFFFDNSISREFSFDVDIKANPNFMIQFPSGDNDRLRSYYRGNRFQLEVLSRNENNQFEQVENHNYRFDFTRESYKTVTYVFLPQHNEVILRYGGEEIFRRTLKEIELQTPDHAIFYYLSGNNAFQGADIDNFSVRQFNAAFEWHSPLSVSAGSLDAFDTQEITFSVRADGLAPGVYTKNLIFETNDPDNLEVVIPVTLNVQAFTSIGDDETLPYSFNLSQNYPNPFNPSTQIGFELPQAGQTELSVYNIQGQRVATLVSGQLSAGEHQIQFDASSLASGVYIYQLRSGSFVQSRKMMLIK